jgi:hypothetical protein
MMMLLVLMVSTILCTQGLLFSSNKISSPRLLNSLQAQKSEYRVASTQFASRDTDGGPKQIASIMAIILSFSLNSGIVSFPSIANAAVGVVKEPLFTKKTAELQPYADIARGFKLQRPFGFNEFQGAGSGYMVKFASLFDVDENIVVGSSSASSDKLESITQYGTPDEIGAKLLKKREGGKLVSAGARETEGTVFYQFEFANPLDPSLPRPGSKNRKATTGIELYELCVAKGKIWSLQVTSNNEIFPPHEEAYRNIMKSFIPRL